MPEPQSRNIWSGKVKRFLRRFNIKFLRHGMGTALKHRSPNKPDEPWEPDGPFPFLCLPRELRDEVYKYALLHPDHNEIWIRYSTQKKKWYNAARLCRTCPNARHEYDGPRARHETNVSLLLASRMVHDEALEVLFAKNDIWLDASPCKTLAFLSQLPPFALNRINRLKLWLDAYLDCHSYTWRLCDMNETELTEQRERAQKELVEPWMSLFNFIGRNLPHLSTLSVRIGPGRWLDLERVGLASREWLEFYHIGWIHRVKSISQIRTLLVEAQCCSCERLSENELGSFDELRKDLWEASRFKEVSLRWDSYFFATGGFDPREYPKASLHIKLERLPDDNRSETSAEEPMFCPLPQFEPKYTPEDMKIIMNWCCVMGGYPPETPNPDR